LKYKIELLNLSANIFIFIILLKFIKHNKPDIIMVSFMAYWLCITNKENWEIIKEENLWGIPEKRKMPDIKPSDKLIFYVKQEGPKDYPKIVGVFEAISEPFDDKTKIFKAPPNSNEVYPHRVKLKLEKIFDPPKNFKEIKDKVSFIKNKQYWSLSLLGRAMIKINENDFKILVS